MIKANFSAYGKYVADSLYQWDLNRVLNVTGLNLTVVPEVHFSNSAMRGAIVRQATMEDYVVSVRIPNSLLQYPLTIKAHIGIYEGDLFKVVEEVQIPVIAKARPEDYIFEDTKGEVYSYKRLENMIENINETWYKMNEAQVQATVTTWLDEHPEATTTVQDGALTEAKFSDNLKMQAIKDYVTPQMYGAKGDGTTDDTVAIQAAINSGKRVFFPSGTYCMSSVTVNGDVLVDGNSDKSVIVPTGDGFILNNALVKKTFRNLRFDCNVGTAITVNAVADTVVANTLSIENCYFDAEKNAGIFAIKLFGENEANIVNCTFYGCNGISIDSSINPNVSDCVFRHSDIGILYAYSGERLANSAYTCGLRVSDTTFLGCVIGIKTVETDNIQVNNCMIDYCDNPVILVGQSGAFLANNFISSRFDNPAIYACMNNTESGKYGGNGLSNSKTEKLTINNCSILTHVDDYTTSKVSAVVLCDCVHSVISNTHITWFTEDGIQLRDCVQTSLSALHIACDSRMANTNNVYAINSYVDGKQEDDGSNHYFDIVSERRIFYHYATIRNVSNGLEDGFSDEVRGSVVVAAGNTSHTVNVNTTVLGAVATLSNPNYAVGASPNGSTITFTFDRALEQNVRINYIVFCTR